MCTWYASTFRCGAQVDNESLLISLTRVSHSAQAIGPAPPPVALQKCEVDHPAYRKIEALSKDKCLSRPSSNVGKLNLHPDAGTAVF